MRCYNCGANEAFVPSSKALTTQVGDVEIHDRSIQLKVCPKCDQWALKAEVIERAELRAAMVALTDLPEMNGDRLRGVRKILGLTQRELGERLDTRSETLSRFENAEVTAPEWLRVAMMGLVSQQLAQLNGHDAIELLPLTA